MLAGKNIVLGISGGIAAYKSVMLLRLLKKAGAEVQVVMTPNAKEFVGPVTLSSLSGKPVVSEFFTSTTGEWHSHVDLGVWADLMVIAPATASTIGKMATGVADNMLITTYLSAKEDVMIAPAMDLDMWNHKSTQRNLMTLSRDGVIIVEPGSGYLASGLSGKGRMAEPEEIFDCICSYFKKEGELKGKKIMITAGPTYEKIDPVRFIGNYSSGKMGYELAAELERRGAKVHLISGPVNLNYKFSQAVNIYKVESAKEMFEKSLEIFPECQIAIFAAAVADYAPEEFHDSKLKREKQDRIELKLKRNPDIAKEMGKIKGDRFTVGFALETDNEKDNALKKLENKNLNLIVLNSLKDEGAGFIGDTNKITILSFSGKSKEFPLKSKREVARDIVDEIIKNLV